MPIDATPLEHVELAVATKDAGELTVLLLAGELTETPDWLLTVTVIGTEAEFPQ
jgi:hypothetical protein